MAKTDIYNAYFASIMIAVLASMTFGKVFIFVSYISIMVLNRGHVHVRGCGCGLQKQTCNSRNMTVTAWLRKFFKKNLQGS